MIKKITCCFSWELKDHLSWFLKYHVSFVNTKERLSSYQLPALKKTSFLRWTPFKKSLFWKFIIWTFPFFLIWTILLCKVHFFHNNFSLSFTETHLSIYLLRDLLNIRFLSSYSIIYIYVCIYIYIYIYIYILSLSTCCIDVKYMLIIQWDIFFFK